jgi:hypothetical protein
VIEFIVQGLALAVLFLPFAFIGCCCGCKCNCVAGATTMCSNDDKMSCQLRVTIFDIASGGACGATCTDLNGTYLLERTSDCTWEYVFPSLVCSTYYSVEALFTVVGVRRRMSIRVWNSGKTAAHVFAHEFGTSLSDPPPDCCTWTDFATTFRFNFAGTPPCNITAAYAEFTSSGL